ncbi:MAG: nucleotidyl transferase AbiEii/AbiGii toxin family protein [Elusimicrobiota bacterium]
MLDYIEIFREFNNNEIKYIVCGGLAVNLHNIPRMTYDIDLLLEMEDENIRKYIQLVREWGFSPKRPVKIEDFEVSEKRKEWINEKNMRSFNVYNEDWAISEIDVLIDTPVDYKQAERNKVIKTTRDITIPLISVKDLIKMKKDTNRKQDEADIRYLKEKLK